MKKRSKKGVSPLIATVIVIGAVIVIASLLFVFMRDTILNNITKAQAGTEGGQKCNGIDIKANSCKIQTTQSISAKIENKGSDTAVQWILRAPYGSSSIESINRAGELRPKQIKNIGGKFTKAKFTKGTGTEVEFIPVVSAKGFPFSCNDRSIKITCK